MNIAKNRVEIGNIEEMLKTGYVDLTLKEILYVPDLKHNLLSVQKIEISGFDVFFRAGKVLGI